MLPNTLYVTVVVVFLNDVLEYIFITGLWVLLLIILFSNETI